MNDYNLMKDLTGKIIRDGKIQSFYLQGNLVSKINSLFFKLDTWIKIVISDGVLTIEKDNQTTDEGCLSEFYYPIAKILTLYPIFEEYLGKKIIECNQLISEANSNWQCGVIMRFEDNLTLIIYEK